MYFDKNQLENLKGNQEIFYFLLVELWQKFCQKHTLLYEITCEEYSFLLENEINKIEKILTQKEKLILEIKELEDQRKSLISLINHTLAHTNKIESVSELILFFKEFEVKNNINHFTRFNDLLIEIIEKIQIQNKKNQVFLNKLIKSLKEITSGIFGGKIFPLYNSQGTYSIQFSK